jgi:predicted small metal-binding protein
MARKVVDCRQVPNDRNCTLTITGEEEEVLRAAVMHAVDVHGHRDTPDFRNELRRALQEERAAAR